MLTGSEISVIAIVVTAATAAWSLRSNRATAKDAVRAQWSLEKARRRDDRRTALYESVLKEVGRMERLSTAPGGNVSDPYEALMSAWSSELALYGSPEVVSEFQNWIVSFVKSYKHPRDTDPPAAVERWQREQGKREEARERLARLMRRDLESWDEERW